MKSLHPLLILFFLLGHSTSSDGQNSCGHLYDGNEDGQVDVMDVIGMLAEYGKSCDDSVVYKLPIRSCSRPVTTIDIPHVKLGVTPVTEVNTELFRRVYSLPGVENRESVIGSWRGLWLSEELTIAVPDAVIEEREFAHIHDDGSLHIFLDPCRGNQAVGTSWAIFHPFAIQQMEGWDGFVMLYTPQTMEELNVVFQLIVDGYNYVTGQNVIATDFY